MATEKLFDTWASRNPQWETKYEDLIKSICNYGKGETSMREVSSKFFGAGYELFIIAFFIGLYSNRRKPLIDDVTKCKNFGWSIENWGNIERRNNRKQYPKIREYIFAALVARTDFDFIALERGETTLRKAVDALITTMEEYANFGFQYIRERSEDNPNWIFKETAFLEIFMGFTSSEPDSDDDEPEDL